MSRISAIRYPRGLLIAALALGLAAAAVCFVIPAAEPVHAVTEVTNVTITGVPMPKEGDHPSVSGIKVSSPGAEVNYSKSATYWFYEPYMAAQTLLDETEYFEDGVVYMIEIRLDPEAGYKFANDPHVTVDGKPVDNMGKINGQIWVEYTCGMAQPLSPAGEHEFYFSAGYMTDVFPSRSEHVQPLETIERGTMVESNAVLNDWVGIDYNGSQGWIRRSQLAIIYDPETAQALMAKVTYNGAVNVRADISTQSERIGALSTGDKVMTTGRRIDPDGKWWYVVDYKGRLGYVMADFLTPVYDYLLSLQIKKLPVNITAKTDAVPMTADPNTVEPKDVNVAGRSDGTLQIRVIPKTGDSFEKLTEDHVILPSAARYVVTDLVFDPSDQGVTVTLQNEWSYNTGNKMKILSPKLKAGKKKVTVTWKKDPQASGYHVRYAYKKDMSDARTKVIKSRKTTKCTIKKLKKGKKVYVQVRPYVAYGGTTYNGLLSKVKSVKVK